MGESVAPVLERSATFSPCEKYRYRLGRKWGPGAPVVFVMLNPSTADAEQDDPTIRRCMGFARSWGFDGLEVLNIFAIRSTDPKRLYLAPDPIGPDNDAVLRSAADAATIVAAWGEHGSYKGRGVAVRQMLPRLLCLGRTKSGNPVHPLYQPASIALADLLPVGG